MQTTKQYKQGTKAQTKNNALWSNPIDTRRKQNKRGKGFQFLFSCLKAKNYVKKDYPVTANGERGFI